MPQNSAYQVIYSIHFHSTAWTYTSGWWDFFCSTGADLARCHSRHHHWLTHGSQL